MSILMPPFGHVEVKPDEPVSEAVESAAKAVGDAMRAYRKGSTLMPWMASPERREAIKYVKAALLSLSEPTTSMKIAGYYACPADWGPTSDMDDVIPIWNAMIDEALK